MPDRRVEPSSDHPLHHVKSLTLNSVSGDVEIALIDGRVARANIGPQSTIGAIVQTTFDTRESTLVLCTAEGDKFVAEIGRTQETVDRPVIYLDQNHWIDLARTATGSQHIEHATKEACERVIELGRQGRILLPLSAGHVVETAKKGGRQRLDVARMLIELSRGWQLRSPLQVRALELDSLFASRPQVLGRDELDVFTLVPGALWADRLYSPDKPRPSAEMPDELWGLQERVTWIASIADVLLEPDPDVSAHGLVVADNWAASFHELAKHMRTNPKAKRYARDLTRTRFITDITQDLALAATRAGASPDRFSEWLRNDAERTISALPALGRIREVMHLRLANADDRWERNDLNDMFYLCTAAGYADVLVGEKKTCSYLKRVESLVPSGAQVSHRLIDALPVIEGLL